MNLFYLGDIHGRSYFSHYCFARHLRPAHHDFGTTDIVWPRLLDNVGLEMGTGDNPSDICNFQLPFSKGRGKEER